jgi:hypothetical protein
VQAGVGKASFTEKALWRTSRRSSTRGEVEAPGSKGLRAEDLAQLHQGVGVKIDAASVGLSSPTA